MIVNCAKAVEAAMSKAITGVRIDFIFLVKRKTRRGGVKDRNDTWKRMNPTLQPNTIK